MENERNALAKTLGLMTENDLALIADVSVETIDDWRRRGNGPTYSTIGRAYYYDIADVRDFIISRKKEKSREGMIRAL
ncbi:helix-turn-helix domain-containing protein [Pseudomonas punonensis]|uniref:helix-turn-helix domain-containing protein n=1 Tax=Phytopseudomonas punonensis TaxID=1220495 RepID=UPI0009344DB7